MTAVTGALVAVEPFWGWPNSRRRKTLVIECAVHRDHNLVNVNIFDGDAPQGASPLLSREGLYP